MPETNGRQSRPVLSTKDKLERLLLFAIFFAVCFILVGIFDTEWVTAALGCLVVGVGGAELNGFSVLTFLSRYRNKKDQ